MKFLDVLRRLGLMLAGMIVVVGVIILAEWPMRRAHVPAAVVAIIVVAIGLGAYAGWVRVVERRSVAELAPRAAVPETVIGFVAGVAVFAAVIGVLAATGIFSVRSFGSWSGAAVTLLGIVAGATSEELVFRGFLYRVVRDIGGTWVAAAVSALFFGAAHAFNPGATIVSSVAIAIEAGVLLALVYALTNRLWLPIGLHAGWNYAEGFVFGTPVSGTMPKHALLLGELHGPVALTGGAFGVEASVAAIAVTLVVSVALAVYLSRRRPALRPQSAATAV